MTVENPIVIENREELIFMLSEASQLEHMLMCEYLFAAFSLKRDVSEGLTLAQSEAVKRWERYISGVAAQEMLHLALASNLLTALGAVPHFNRPNFPQQAKYYPPGVQLVLLPFGEQALQHFIYLERPEGFEDEDAEGFEVRSALDYLPMTVDDIVPVAQSFATVGHLYRGIEQGFRHLVEKYGEEQVFVGPPKAQATRQHFGWPELIAVTDLASAVTAIENIVRQGEGAQGNWQEAHYGKFRRILEEYRELKAQDPNFEPTRPVKAAGIRPASDIDLVKPTIITEPVTAGVADLFNASYEVLLQMLIRFFIHSGETEQELKTLSDACVGAMFQLIKPLGELLTRLPIGPDFPGMTAGPIFEIYRTGYMLPHRHAAWVVLHERFLELADFCAKLNRKLSAPPELAVVEQNLRKLADMLAQHLCSEQIVPISR